MPEIFNLEYFLIFLNGFIVFLVAVISENFNPIATNKKRLKKGALIFFGLWLLVIPILQKNIGDVEDLENKKNEKFRADSTINKNNVRSDSLHRITMQGFGDAVGKYGLSYDSTLRELKKTITNQNQTRPNLQFLGGNEVNIKEIEDDFFDIDFNLISRDAGSRNIDVKIHYAVGDSATGTPQFLNSFIILESKRLAINEITPTGISLNDELKKKYDALYFWAEGSYTHDIGSKREKIDQVMVYFFKKQISMKVNPIIVPKIISYFKESKQKQLLP